MAYIPSFDHDIFISYAHADNLHGARVTAFHGDLVQRLIRRLGARAFHKPMEWIFFDRHGLKAGDEISPTLERSVRRSAVMLSLISPSYLQAPFCVRETEWFLDSKSLARDPIERRLIPILLNHTDDTALQQFPNLATSRLWEALCTEHSTSEPGSAAWNDVLDRLGSQIADHLQDAREKHGTVYVGRPYQAAEGLRSGLIDELRGFRCVPEYAIFGQEDAVRRALGESKLAVHFLGAPDAEVADTAEAILLSLDHCVGKTVGFLPPGQRLSEDERQLIARTRDHPRWTQPQCTLVELAQILTRELESHRLPDPSTRIALACDKADLNTVIRIGSEIHNREDRAFTVSTPDFLAEPGSLPFIGWRKLLTNSQSVIVYWGAGQKQYLDANVARYLAAAKFGRAWYVALQGSEDDEKRGWQPDRESVKIIDEDQDFSYERLRGFLAQVRERARQ